MMSVKATIDTPFRLTLATSPSVPGATVLLTDVYGVDGSSVGADGDGSALSFPVSMDEGLDGVYSVEVMFEQQGVYWARFSVNGVPVTASIVRVEADEFQTADARSNEVYTVALVDPNGPVSVQLTIADFEGELAGVDEAGTAIVWPQAMTQVTGHSDSWYYEPVVFTEGGRYQAAFAPSAGPIRNAVLSVHQEPAAIGMSHRYGWEPLEGMNHAAWVSIGYIRRWTGWSSDVTAETIRELRRTAISTWISETNMWVPAWRGVFHGLPAQGSRLYLPMPVLLPGDGGTTPTIEQTYQEGDQDVVQTVDLDDVWWRVQGRYAKQPYVEYTSWWDVELDVKVTATFGLIGYDETVPTPVRQAIVGLIRWHMLSYGTDGSDARDQSTMYRMTAESTRDARVDYDPRSVGAGVTGDRHVDKVIAMYRIDPAPWVSKCGLVGRV